MRLPYHNFLIIARAAELPLDIVNNMLLEWVLLPISEEIYRNSINYESKKIVEDILNGKLFESTEIKVRDLSYNDIEQLLQIKGQLSKIIQIGILLNVKDFETKLAQRYFTTVPEGIFNLYKKYLFNIDEMTVIDWNNYVSYGKLNYPAEFRHIEIAAHDPEFAQFVLEGDTQADIGDMVRKASFIAYKKFYEAVQEDDLQKAKVFGDLLVKAAKVKFESKKVDFIDTVKKLKLEWEQQTMETTQLNLIENKDEVIEPDPREDVLPDEG